MRRFVHVGTEAALLAGEPLVEVDETAPLRVDSLALYSSTKACAEAVPKLGGAQRPTSAAAMIRAHTHGLERRAATKLI